jgi:hypothetical protein
MEVRPSRCAAYALVFLSIMLLLAATSMAQNTYTVSTSSYSQSCIITNQQTTPDGCIVASLPYMFIGVLLSFMIIAIVYMFGNIMNFKPMQDWYRAELWESIKTILMIGVIIATLATLSAVADILVGAQYVVPFQGNQHALSTNLANLYNADNTYITNQLYGSYQAYAAVLGLNVGVNILKSVSLSLWIPIPLIPPDIFGALQFGSVESILKSNFISANPGESSYSITQNITGLVVVPMLIAFQLQASYFYDLIILGLGILVPLGIVFRAFPLIRNIGGTLIATGIGLAIVYPAMILIINMPVSNYIYSFTSVQPPVSSCPFQSGLMCKVWNAMTAVVNQPTGITTVSGPGLVPVPSPTSIAELPLTVALGTTATSNVLVSGALLNGEEIGLITPLTAGLFPSLNFVLNNTLGMILQLLLLAIDILFGLIITGTITQILGGKVRLGIGKKLSFKTG